MTAPTQSLWRMANGRAVSLDPGAIVAILNITPDSFHEASRTPDVGDALARASLAIEHGAHMLDIGGESTRPGAPAIGADEQVRRVVPVIRDMRNSRGPLADIPISVDTTLAPVAVAALDAGADAVNDVSAGRDDPDMLRLLASRQAGVVLMHRLALPEQDRYSHQYDTAPTYTDVAQDVRAFLHERSRLARAAGIAPDRIVLDPGLGFGKSVEQNLTLVRSTGVLLRLGYPIMSAASRKSFLGVAGAVGGANHPAGDPSQRLAPSLALTVMHWLLGARIFRVHDVQAHAQALRTARAIHEACGPPPESGRPV